MEENIRRDARRARDARAAFSASGSSASAEEPDARPARRRAAPAVTFQPPQPGSSAEGHSPEEVPRPPRVRKATPKPSVAKVPPQPTAPTEPSAGSEVTASPAKATAAKKAAPRPARKAPAAKAAPAAGAAPAAKAPAPKQAPTEAPTASDSEAATTTKATTAPDSEAAAATKATAAPVSKATAAKKAAPGRKAKPATPEPARKTTRPRKAVETATPIAPTREPTVQALAVDLWPALLANPAQAPETLANAAVETIGPRALAWADGIRATYPRATPDGLARLATLRFTRSAGLRAGLGAIAGPYAPAALVTAAAITQAELVLHLAAAYGRDATDPQRTADLLRLVPFEKRWLAAWAAVRIADRALPGVSLAAAVLAGRNAVETVAARARRFYRESQSSQESGSS